MHTQVSAQCPKENKETHSIDAREEQCVSGGLVPHSQMITPNEALPACADNIISKVISQLYGLIDPTATIAQICCLRRPEVCTEALYIAW
jgi:hypothetical protein